MARLEKFLCAIRKSRYFSSVTKNTLTGVRLLVNSWSDRAANSIALFLFVPILKYEQ